MIKGYSHPQSIIKQVLQSLPDAQIRDFHAFVFGPQYDLFRYTKAAERVNMKGVAFAENISTEPADRQLIPYEGLKPTHIVDKNFVRLYGENLEGQLWDAQSSKQPTDENLFDFKLASLEEPNKVRVIRRGAVIKAMVDDYSDQVTGAQILFPGSGYTPESVFDVAVAGGAGSGAVLRVTVAGESDVDDGFAIGTIKSATVVSSGSGYTETGSNPGVVFEIPSASIGANVGVKDDTLVGELKGRPIKPGDAVYVKLGSEVARRIVKRIERATLDSHYGTDEGKADKAFAASPLNPIESKSAVFGNISAPPSWNIFLNRTTLLDVELVAGGANYADQPDVYVSAPLAVNKIGTPSTDDAAYIWNTAPAVVNAKYKNGKVTGFHIEEAGAGYFDGGVVAIKVTSGGSGYSKVNPPKVSVADPATGNSAEAYAVVADNGSIERIVVTDPGNGYTAAPIVLLIGGNPAVEATAVSILSRGVQSVVVTNPGNGYTVAPAITVAPPDVVGGEQAVLQAVLTDDGQIAGVKVVKSGSGYTTTSPTVTIAAPGGGGTQAVLSVTWGVKPAIQVIDTDGGTGARAAAVVASVETDWNGLLQGARYDGQYAERYTLTVTRVGDNPEDCRLRLRSASGAFTAENIVAKRYGKNYAVQHPALGGLAIELVPPGNSSKLTFGSVFTFVIVGKYKPLDLSTSGQVRLVNIVDGGTGYTSDATVIFAAPPEGGVRATGTVIVNESVDDGDPGIITGIAITNPGSGYLTPPACSIVRAGGTGDQAIVETVITTPETSRDIALVQSSTYHGPKDTRYKVTVVKGTSYVPTDNSFHKGVLRVEDSSGVDVVQELTVEHGVEYPLGTFGLRFILPKNLVSPSGLAVGTTAELTAVVAGGKIVSVTIDEPGEGYVEAPEILVTGAGAGAILEAKVINGAIVAVDVVSGGSGYTSAPTLTVEDPITFQGGLRTGDVYYVDAVARKADGAPSVIVLNGQAVDTSGWSSLDVDLNKLDIEVRALSSGIIEPKRDTAPVLAYEVGDTAAGGILLKDSLKLKIAERDIDSQWVPVKTSPKGRLFAHWRGLVPATSSDRIKLYASEADIKARFGVDDWDNPICRSAIIAFRAAQEKPVFVGSLRSDDLAGYTYILRQAEAIEGACFLAPSTYDNEVIEQVKTHVSKVSAANWKMWRRAYVAMRNPGSYALAVTDEDNNNLEAQVLTSARGNVRVICTNGNFLQRGIRPGDLFRTEFAQNEWNEPTYKEYVVENVLEDDELVLVSGPSAPVTPAIKFEIWRPDNGLSQAEYVGNRSQNLLNRRTLNVWVDSGATFNDQNQMEVVENFYVAAEVAGLRSALLPQQGLTYTELQHSIRTAPLMFSKYTTEELDLAAAKGTFIVMQDREEGPVFIRHQLTTDTNNGSLFYEDSVGVNLDSISYAIKDLVQPYLGKRNANREAVEELDTKIRHVLDSYKEDPKTGFTNIGPALIDYKNLVISIDPVQRDKINIEVTLEFPLPINTVEVTLKATQMSDETLIEIIEAVLKPKSE